ncbi:TRAP transporter large permease [Alteribacillus iranensis]|uniref:TRAP transporter, DctM subunit n=1 Tax=Alteribacillus iranensis TaxID=930128 RepID=A0A1I2B6I1_9BACI|nr:TRAP transporter large permease subunit [Alteribacillus iranensis]SFE51765.1 TRAP transporter, DctM subunit [Alteribacillus iranensis]
MGWIQLLLLILIGLLLLMLIKLPIAFAFMFINIMAAIFLWGGERGLFLLIQSIQDSLTSFSLAPIPFFILMGEIMFHGGIASKLINTIDKWFGKLPGRLSMMSVGGGSLLSTLTGSSMGSIAILGSTLLPEMENKGYKNPMSIGPILGSGGLAVMIPPSALGVLLASIGQISIGDFMISIILPGVLMAILMSVYIIIRAKMNPSIAPTYEVQAIPFSEKAIDTIKYILPLSFIIFLVIGLIFLGVATPTESAAMGVFGSVILALCYKSFNYKVVKESIIGTLKITGMILIIVAGSAAFSQTLSYTGATRHLTSMVSEAPLSPMIIVLLMLLLVIAFGTFMESITIMMITLPIFVPIVEILGFNLLWFGVLMLIAIEIGTISPPFGVNLFVMKSVVKKGVSMKQIYAAAFPFIIINLLLVFLIILVPEITTWLPDMVRSSE